MSSLNSTKMSIPLVISYLEPLGVLLLSMCLTTIKESEIQGLSSVCVLVTLQQSMIIIIITLRQANFMLLLMSHLMRDNLFSQSTYPQGESILVEVN